MESEAEATGKTPSSVGSCGVGVDLAGVMRSRGGCPDCQGLVDEEKADGDVVVEGEQEGYDGEVRTAAVAERGRTTRRLPRSRALSASNNRVPTVQLVPAPPYGDPPALLVPGHRDTAPYRASSPGILRTGAGRRARIRLR